MQLEPATPFTYVPYSLADPDTFVLVRLTEQSVKILNDFRIENQTDLQKHKTQWWITFGEQEEIRRRTADAKTEFIIQEIKIGDAKWTNAKHIGRPTCSKEQAEKCKAYLQTMNMNKRYRILEIITIEHYS